MLAPLIALLFASTSVFAQDVVFDSIHNVTSLEGTWSSGSQQVVTGSGFANPANETFTYPSTTGVSYSFTNPPSETEPGWFETARYRFNSNGTEPNCITGILIWMHGTYALLPNGSIILTPVGDGYQQVQDPCAAESNFIQDYNFTETYQSFRIFQDLSDGPKLHMFNDDGSAVAPQFQVSASPNMLPLQTLRNTTSTNALTVQNALAVNSGASQRWVGAGAGSVAVASFSVGIISLLL